MINSTLGKRWQQWMKARGSWRMIKRSQTPGLDPEPYLERFYILRIGPYGVFLHNFWASDPDPFHCHPWPFAVMRLIGSYVETGPDGVRRLREPGAVVLAGAERFHNVWVAEEDRGKCWSLFAHGKRWRKWGFLQEDGSWESATDSGNQSSIRVKGWLFPKFPTKVREPTVEQLRFYKQIGCPSAKKVTRPVTPSRDAIFKND